MDTVKWLIEYVLGEWRVLKGAPGVVILLLIISAGIVFGVEEWHYAGVEETLHATIDNKQSRIDQLQDQLKGTSPQLAAIQAGRDKIREQLQRYYVESGKFLLQPMSSKDEAIILTKQIDPWAHAVNNWASKNLGTAAAMRIFDPESEPSLMWGVCTSQECNSIRNWLFGVRRNLSTLIQTAAWDGRPAPYDSR